MTYPRGAILTLTIISILSVFMYLLLNSLFQSPYVPRIFQLFDKDKSGNISLGELIDGFQLLVNGTQEQKLNFLFDTADLNGKIYFHLKRSTIHKGLRSPPRATWWGIISIYNLTPMWMKSCIHFENSDLTCSKTVAYSGIFNGQVGGGGRSGSGTS